MALGCNDDDVRHWRNVIMCEDRFELAVQNVCFQSAVRLKVVIII